ncbi:MAG TPA: hypothetical protein VNX68_12535, partial [Nitrosopumilaceae archaeon]|nr:hypothetical protein [Nitrosopumilaceae archaeon]
NISFGMGGGLLQKDIHRDIQKFAFKCSSAVVDGQQRDVFKSPLDSDKISKKGRMSLIYRDNKYKTVPDSDRPNDLLQLVFENGQVINPTTLDEIRIRSDSDLLKESLF